MTQHTNMIEKSLEDIIVNHLVDVNKYEQGKSGDYNYAYALDEKRLEAFLFATQPDLVRTSRIFDNAVNRSKFLGRVRDEITKRGVVDVLRKGVKHLSNPTFVLYEPYPSELSEVGKKLYKLNKFSVIRQLHYSQENTLLSIDVVLFVNGLPVVTMELKNQITVQNTADAVRQYRTDRDPKDLLFMHKRCAVHFAVDDVDIQMCTKLCGAESWFLPFNKGVNDGAGNPVNPNGLRTSYLWEDILTKARFSDILEHYAQVAIEEDPETKKKTEKTIWPRYHQLECVRALLSHTEAHQVGEKYLIQHSAGSGKSNSITWLAYQLVEMKESGQDKFDSVILVTDRVNLDKQLRNNVNKENHIESSLEYMQHIPLIGDGVSNLKNLLSWPEVKEPSELQFVTPSFYEYVTFYEGVRKPFFQIANSKLSNCIDKLFDYSKEKERNTFSNLTHDEAFDFLCTLGHTDTRNIIDHYNRLPSNVYTEVINSIYTQDKAAFSASLKETDCQDLMGVLWTIRYLLFGIQSENDAKVIKRGKRIRLENLWLTDTGLAPFFRNIPKEEEERFAEERIKLLCGFNTKSFARRQRIGRQQHNCEAIAATRPYTHYIDSKRKPWKQFLLESEEEAVTSTSLSSLTYNCKIQTYKILLSALRSHKDAISNRFGNFGGKSFSVAIEQKWKNEDWDYVELDCQDFQDFITLSLQQMRSVFLMLDGFLNEEDKDLLNWIVSLYTDDKQQAILAEEHKDTLHEGQALDGDESTISREKWHVTVLSTKLKGNNSEEKDRELFRCLSLLYDELTKEGLIDTTSSKSLFIIVSVAKENLIHLQQK